MATTTRPGLPLVIDRDARRTDAVAALTRAAISASRHVFDRSVSAAEIARRTWGESSRPVEMLLRAASGPATTSTPSWAGALSQTTNLFLSSLIPQSAGFDLLNRGMVLNFDGAGAIQLPALTQKAAPFVGETRAIPVTQFNVASGVKLEPRKIAFICSLTREMIESSNAEQIVRAALVESAAIGLDAQLFSANAATVDAPAGLLAGIAPTTASTSSLRGEATAQDLAVLGGAVARVAGGQITYVTAPEQRLSIALLAPTFSYAVLTSSALPARTVIAIAPAALAAAFDSVPAIEASREVGSMHMEDAPAEMVTGAGVVARPAMSVFQTDNVALKMRMRASWALRAPGALAWMQNVIW